jgi:hypothetical protein
MYVHTLLVDEGIQHLMTRATTMTYRIPEKVKK